MEHLPAEFSVVLVMTNLGAVAVSGSGPVRTGDDSGAAMLPFQSITVVAGLRLITGIGLGAVLPNAPMQPDGRG